MIVVYYVLVRAAPVGFSVYEYYTISVEVLRRVSLSVEVFIVTILKESERFYVDNNVIIIVRIAPYSYDSSINKGSTIVTIFPNGLVNALNVLVVN